MIKLRSIIAYWPWIIVFTAIKLGSGWYLLSLDAVGHAVAWGTLCLIIFASFSQKKEILKFGPAGSQFALLKFVAVGIFAIFLNIAATVIYAVCSANEFEFFSKSFWTYAIGSNCLIFLFFFIIPSMIVGFIAYNNADEIEQTGFDLEFC